MRVLVGGVQSVLICSPTDWSCTDGRRSSWWRAVMRTTASAVYRDWSCWRRRLWGADRPPGDPPWPPKPRRPGEPVTPLKKAAFCVRFVTCGRWLSAGTTTDVVTSTLTRSRRRWRREKRTSSGFAWRRGWSLLRIWSLDGIVMTWLRFGSWERQNWLLCFSHWRQPTSTHSSSFLGWRRPRGDKERRFSHLPPG